MPKAQPDWSHELLTTAQACSELGVSRGTLEKFWRDGQLERVKFGGQVRYRARSLRTLIDTLLTGNTVKPTKRKQS